MVFCHGGVVGYDLLRLGNYRGVLSSLQVFNAVETPFLLERFEDVLDVKVLSKFEYVSNNLQSECNVLRWKVGC